MPHPLAQMLAAQGLPVAEAVPMHLHTTLKVGGPAALWVQARGPADIQLATAQARAAGVAVQVIGLGSNLLIRDGGLPGLTLCVGPKMADIRIEGTLIYAQAGARLAQVAQAAQAAGLAGMEALAGIPGTVGGAICMNAGAYGTEIASLVQAVEMLTPDGGVQPYTAAEMAFGYRHSLLMDVPGLVVTAATLALVPGDAQAIADTMRQHAIARREKQPLALPSAGSFFKRPQGHFAGALIEAAGLKGVAVGGAQVSPLHAGFLVNNGGATAADFIALMELVQARVYQTSGVRLETEVRILGCDSPC